MFLILGCRHLLAELVGAFQLFDTVALFAVLDSKDESTAVSGAASAGIPIFIGDGTETIIFRS
jgi:ribosomal protein S2